MAASSSFIIKVLLAAIRDGLLKLGGLVVCSALSKVDFGSRSQRRVPDFYSLSLKNRLYSTLSRVNY